MAETAAALFALCRGTGNRRNDVPRSLSSVLRYNGSRERCAVQRQDNAMRAILGAVLAILLLCSASAFAGAPAESSDKTIDETIALGKALAIAGGCASCHTADPAKPFAGGKRIDTPFGGIYSPNLTPDRETGLGAWSDDDFYRALHDGIARDGSRYYPAFPYPNFTKMTRDDVLAIRAYLATLTPVNNTRPPPQLRWPLNYRVVMRGWNLLFFRPGTFQANPQASDAS